MLACLHQGIPLLLDYLVHLKVPRILLFGSLVLVFELCNLILQALHLGVSRLLQHLHRCLMALDGIGHVLLQDLIFIIELLDMLGLLDDARGLDNGFYKTEIIKYYEKMA